jgi:hypothetical protein
MTRVVLLSTHSSKYSKSVNSWVLLARGCTPNTVLQILIFTDDDLHVQDTYKKTEKVIVTHCCRHRSDKYVTQTEKYKA